ncbi:vesicle trafficking 1 isoform X2 [Lycorma delicatula]|uniref:vesicle trafficking 1 isoform X2 n=1 Tax=Lycorma delicatula TaxID=130591 RepID=UPI003F510622
MPVELPPCPASLRAIQHYLKTAAEHDDRDPVVSYWCRLCALQTALKIDKKSDEAKVFLMGLMDWLEVSKKNMRENESVTNEVAAQAYIENYALKLFFWADGQDRAGIFNKNVVKAFYTAGMLMDVLCVFGELTDEVVANRKYAKWKAAYIHNCLKNGEMPVPGPMKDDGDENNTNIYVPSTSDNTSTPPPNIGFQFEPSGGPSLPDPPNTLNYGGNSSIAPPPLSMPGSASTSNDNSLSRFNISQPPSTPTPEPQDDSSNCKNLAKETGNMLDPEKITKAQKYCKWAISALNYDDVPEAVSNIKKALHLLQTGEES